MTFISCGACEYAGMGVYYMDYSVMQKDIEFKLRLCEPIRRLKNKTPLVQCITNFVTVNDCANIILAAGGTPSMAQDEREVYEAVEKADALVCNMGAIEHLNSMLIAGTHAAELSKPVVLDPVAAGGTALRRDASKSLLDKVHFSVIRGNASEIRFLAGEQTCGSGVDVSTGDEVSADNLASGIAIAQTLAKKTKSVIVISGVCDIIADKDNALVLNNGCATMARITGSGCMLTSMIGAFCGAMPEDAFTAAISAVAVMGIAGEMADKRRIANGTGNATFRNDLIDAVFNMTEEQLAEHIRYQV